MKKNRTGVTISMTRNTMDAINHQSAVMGHLG